MPISMNNTTLTFNNGTTMTTAATGTVSSVATGNGLQGGTITTSGTLSVACPGANTVGSYASVYTQSIANAVYYIDWNGNYAAGTGRGQMQASGMYFRDNDPYYSPINSNVLSGTWKWLGASTQLSQTNAFSGYIFGLACRVS
jgi:hypothetical protein